MAEKFKYYAFISYTTADTQAAEELQHFLETYKLPVQLCEEFKVPESLAPIFRDVTNLPPGKLHELLKQELERSRYLIVVCSPNSARSAWVNREVEFFIELGRYANIIPYIIKGTVGDKRHECYPPILRNPPEYRDNPNLDLSRADHRRENERIKAYLRTLLVEEPQLNGVSLDREGPEIAHGKIIATMLGLDPDAILNTKGFTDALEKKRRQRAEAAKKRAAQILASLGLIAAILTALTLYVYFSRTPIFAPEPPVETHYYADYVEKFGVPVGIEELKLDEKEQVPRRNRSWRITSRNGITLDVTCVDSFGNPRAPGHSEYSDYRHAHVRLIYTTEHPDRFPNWECYDEKGEMQHTKTCIPSADGRGCFVEFKYLKKRAVDLKSPSRQNTEASAPRKDSSQSDPVSDEFAFQLPRNVAPSVSSYENLARNFGIETTVAPVSRITQRQVFFTEEGYTEMEWYVDSNGKIVADFDGSFGRSYEYDDPFGRMTKVVCVDARKKPMDNLFGYAAKSYAYGQTGGARLGGIASVEWKNFEGKYVPGLLGMCREEAGFDPWGNIKEERYFSPDPEDRSVYIHSTENIRGVATWKLEYDEHRGLPLKYTYFDSRGEPASMSGDNPIDVQEMTYHPNGMISSVTFHYNIASESFGCSKVVNTFDENENVVRCESFDAEGRLCMHADRGIAAVAFEYDEGNNTCTRFFDVGKNPCLSSEEIAGWTSEYDEKNRERKRSLFDVDGKPTALGGDDPHDSWEKTFHDNGKAATQTWFYTVKPHPNGCRKWKTSYDERGNVTDVEYFDLDGDPCLDENSVAKRTSRYDDDGREIRRSFFGVDGKPCLNYEAIAGWIPEYDEKNRESKRSFFNVDGKPTALDGNDPYDSWEKTFYDNGVLESWTWFYRLKPHPNGCRKWKMSYDERGKTTAVEFFDGDGVPCLTNEKIAKRTSRYDDDGREIRRSFFGVDGKPCLSENAHAGWNSEYDGEGREIRRSFFGVDGAPCLNKEKIAKRTSRYDADGREIRRSFFGVDDKPCLCDDAYAGWNSEYDGEGREIRRTFFDVDGNLKDTGGDDPYDSWEKTFHDNGKTATQIWFYTVKPHPNGCRKWKTSYDGRGKITDVEFFDLDGVPCLNDNKIAKRTSQYDADGREIRRSFFGVDGKPCLSKELFAGWTSEYDEKNREIRRTFFGLDGKLKDSGGDDPYDSWEKTFHDNDKIATQAWFYRLVPEKFSCSKIVFTYNRDGNRTKSEYFDADGKPCLNHEAVAAWTSEYDEKNREIKRSFFGVDGEPTVLGGDNPHDSWKKTFRDNGTLESWTWFYRLKPHSNGCRKWFQQYDDHENIVCVEFFGVDDKPCLNHEAIAGWTSEYDEKNREIKRSFFGVNGKPTALGGDTPYDSWEKTYHENGKTASRTNFYTVKPHPGGYRKWKASYDERGETTGVEFFDLNGAPCLNKEKIAKRTSQYDADGREIRRSFFGVDDKPCLCDDAYAGWNSEFDGEDREIRRTFFGLDGKLKDSGGDDPYDSWEKTFHDNGKTATQICFYTVKPHPNGCRKWKTSYDERGKITAVEYFDLNGDPCLNENKIAKRTSECDENGNEIRCSFFGVDGKPCLSIELIAGWTSEYDEKNREIRRTLFGVDGKLKDSGGDDPYDSWEKTFHDNGKIATQTWLYRLAPERFSCSKIVFTYNRDGNRTKTEFFDADGKPCLSKEFIAGWTSEYDEKNREIRRTLFGVDGKPTALGGDDPFDSWEKTFHDNGKIATQTWLYVVTPHPNGCRKWKTSCDERGNVTAVEFFDLNDVPCLNDDKIAKRTSRYDADGRETLRSFFDVDGKPCIQARSGLASIRYFHDENGDVIDQKGFDLSGNEVDICPRVGKVLPGKVGDALGIESGDYFVTYDGAPAGSPAKFIAVRKKEPEGGSAKTLKILRGDSIVSVEVEPGKLEVELFPAVFPRLPEGSEPR